LLTNLGRLSGVFTTGESQLPGDEYTGESRLPGVFTTGGPRLPGSEYTRESITNSNNSSNIRKNSKSFLGVSNGTRRRCLMKKTGVKKSRDTVPLTSDFSTTWLLDLGAFVLVGTWFTCLVFFWLFCYLITRSNYLQA
jgi:hypothetical protein